MKLRLLTQEEWAPLSECAHEQLFGTHKPAKNERIDFVLLMVSDEGKPLAYGTFQEKSGESVHWQYGGVFPENACSIRILPGYLQMFDLLRSKYKRVTTYVENKNTRMLKLAMKVGYHIIGVRYIHDKLFLEHLMEFDHG